MNFSFNTEYIPQMQNYCLC